MTFFTIEFTVDELAAIVDLMGHMPAQAGFISLYTDLANMLDEVGVDSLTLSRWQFVDSPASGIKYIGPQI